MADDIFDGVQELKLSTLAVRVQGRAIIRTTKDCELRETIDFWSGLTGIEARPLSGEEKEVEGQSRDEKVR